MWNVRRIDEKKTEDTKKQGVEIVLIPQSRGQAKIYVRRIGVVSLGTKPGVRRVEIYSWASPTEPPEDG